MEGLRQEEIDGLKALAKKLEVGDWYDLLGLDVDFTSGDLKKAYYDLSRSYHPDRFYRRDIRGHEHLIEIVFAGINKAYNVLRDSTERRRYDESLHEKTGRRPPRRKPKAARPAPKPPEETPEPDIGTSEVEMDVGHRRGERRRRPKIRQAPSKPSAARPQKAVPPHIQKLRRQIAQRLAKARRYHQTAMKEIEDEQWVKAASSLYLACQYAPKNQEYKRLHAETAKKASGSRVSAFIAEAENAESYRNIKQAVYSYEKAIEYDPPEGKPWYRLAELLVNFEEDDRGALVHYRTAVEKEPDNITYRLALANQFAKLEMHRNAKREFQAVLERDPRHEEAKAGLKKVRFS